MTLAAIWVHQGWHQRQGDLIAVVHAQLPAQLRDTLSIDVIADPYGLKMEAVFADGRGREWRCLLEAVDLDGASVACRVPELFLAELSALV